MESFKSNLQLVFTRAHLIRFAKIILVIAALIHVYALLLRFIPVPGTILMMQRAVQGEDVRRDWTPLEDISPNLPYAVIGAEDARFCQHHGIDWKAVEQVLEERERTGRKRGGSTITQQTAKNVFLWNGGGWIRKLPESWMSLFIDAAWSKHRIMEVYLNVAEWGDGVFGAEAAAQARFGKSAKDLTLYEASLLAAVLPSPHKWRLDPPGDYVKNRAKTLRARAADVSYGGYGGCLKLDEKVNFPASQKLKPKEKTPEPKPAEDKEAKNDLPKDVAPKEVTPTETGAEQPNPDTLGTLLDNIEDTLENEPDDIPNAEAEDDTETAIEIKPLEDEAKDGTPEE